MRIIYDTESGKIKALATDDYSGPEVYIDAPDGFTPSDMDRFTVQNGEVVGPSKVEEKLQRINDAKNTALDGGFMLNGILWDSDAKARLAYLELVTKLNDGPTYTTYWKASSGNWVNMTAELFQQVKAAYEAHVNACFMWQAMREQEVALAVANGDMEALDAVSESVV